MNDIKKACDILNDGGVVGIPTETVYGLAGSIESKEGIKNIFSTKERPFFDPLIIHVASIEQAKKYSKGWSKITEKLAHAFWPGPLTLILPKNELVDDQITSGLESVGIRMPKHEMTLELINKLGHPIAAPSANKFKKTSPTSAEHVRREFPNIFILDGGECEVGIESTIVSAVADKVLIYRPGMISKIDIQNALKGFNIEVMSASSPVAPGQLKHHYMPSSPIALISNKKLYQDLKGKREDFLINPIEWELPIDPIYAARILYAKFRELDDEAHSCISIIVSQTQIKDDRFAGILNRLEKASTYFLTDKLTKKS